MNTRKIIIANWKMYKPHQEALDWLDSYFEELDELTQFHDIILCPEFTTLADAAKILQTTSISLGAQDCSSHEAGAFTGQIPAHSLADIDCTYCLVGHSEVKKHCCDTPQTVIHKTWQLLKYDIIPILCFADATKNTQEFLKELGSYLQGKHTNKQTIMFAYEPLESIGALHDSPESIAQILATLASCAQAALPRFEHKYLYGGGVNSHSIAQLAGIPSLDGFLVGKASLDFQSLKKIVLSIHT